jgi:hypothetical protein
MAGVDAMTDLNLIGVWRTVALGRDRHIYVTRTDDRYAYGFPCDPTGRAIAGRNDRRILLHPRGDRPQRYRRPDRKDAS